MVSFAPSLLGPLPNRTFEVIDRSEWPTWEVEQLFVLVPAHRRLGHLQVVEDIAGRGVEADLPDEPMQPRTLSPSGEDRDRPDLISLRVPDGTVPWAAVGARVGRAAKPGSPLDCLVPRMAQGDLRAFVLGVVRGAHTTRAAEKAVTVRLWVGSARAKAVAEEALLVAQQVLFARDLSNEPSNRKNPQWLAHQARAVAGRGLRVRTLDESALERQGFGGVLAVGRGSAEPVNVTVLDYRGPGRGHPRVVLVGKGITFDSGGLSLKPPPSMPLMKTDMTGAAAVIGTLAAVRDLGLPLRVTGIIACAENMPGGSAMRPGDVVRQYSGRTTEVLNTDAEGRLVLADCLAYAAERFDPDFLVDIASLTGAATLGLGRQHAALYSRDRALAAALAATGSGDAVWPMPLVDEYRAAIASDVADAANTNTDPGVSAGSITAALFLEPFAAGRRWAHLDIAGAARTETDLPDCRKGATGFGVSLLTHWLARLAGRRW
jgi:leucyl aminopeptidase